MQLLLVNLILEELTTVSVLWRKLLKQKETSVQRPAECYRAWDQGFKNKSVDFGWIEDFIDCEEDLYPGFI